MTRFVPLFLLFCALMAAPYVFFQVRINEAFLGAAEAGAWNLVRYVKFVSFALIAPACIGGIFFLGGKMHNWWAMTTTFIYLLVLLVLVNYYDYFGMVPHWNQLGNLDEAQHLGGHIRAQLLGPEDWLTALSVALGAGLLLGFLNKPTNWLRFAPVLVALPGLLLLGVQLVRYPIVTKLNAHGYTMGCSHFGITPTYAVMLLDFLPHKPREVAFPKAAHADQPSDYHGRLERQNVLVVQVESLDASLIGRRIAGEPVMPFLESLAARSAYFPHCVAMHAGGGSSDAELGSLLSLVPLTSGSGFSTADWTRITPLSRTLNSADYTCVAMHPNRGSFYERNRRYEAMGFAAYYDQKSFTGSAAGWYSKDDAFFKQGLEKLKGLPQPFFGYFITMQSHGPFKNYSPQTRKEFDAELDALDPLEADYLCSFRDVDHALAGLFDELKTSSLLNSTLVIIHGDHESGVVENAGNGAEHVPLIFSHPMLPALRSARLVSHLDVAPTITDLLAMPASERWLGSSVFSDSPVEYIVMPDGAAVTATTSSHSDEAFRHVDYSRALLGR